MMALMENAAMLAVADELPLDLTRHYNINILFIYSEQITTSRNRK